MKRNFSLIFGIICLSLIICKNVQAQAVFPSFADLAEQLLPSVVNISTTHDKTDIDAENSEIENHIETSVDSIFNAPQTNKVSLGSGFIISTDGYIITNNHVIDKSYSISVTLSDNTVLEAKLIGRDAKTDIALIKVESTQPMKPVIFGNSDKIRVGDWILAIGNPFGLGGSVTAGIVSAKSRDIETGPYDNFIQTDASINQGSSGGPMFNLNGEVIGVNTAIFSTNGGNMGIGFAIPVNLIDFVIKQLKTYGEVKRGWIGIKMQSNLTEVSESLGLSENKGVIISEVPEASSAAKAGMKAGDIILKFNGSETYNTRNLSRLVAETPIGQTVDVEIWRNNQKQIIKVTLEQMPEEISPKKENLSETNSGNELGEKEVGSEADFGLGISLAEITPDLADKYNLSQKDSGMIVVSVAAESDAAKKGVKVGDLITQIDKKPIIDNKDVALYVNDAVIENKRPVLLQIKDGEQLHLVAIKLSAASKKIKEKK